MGFCLCLLTLQIFPWWAKWGWLPRRKGSWVTCHSFLFRRKLPTKVLLAVHWLWGNNSVGWDSRSQQRACLEYLSSLGARQLCLYTGFSLQWHPPEPFLRGQSSSCSMSHSTPELFHSTFKPAIFFSPSLVFYIDTIKVLWKWLSR